MPTATQKQTFTWLATAALALLPAMATAQYGMIQRHLYDENANANRDIQIAETQALAEHKRILLEFGGNWCGDCTVLDYYEHQGANADLLAKNYIVVHIDIGHMDHNVDIAEHYHVPITKGVPALAVLDGHGRLLYAEQPKEFEHTTPGSINTFLTLWKPGPRG